MPKTHLNRGEFRNELWIRGKTVFTRPERVDVEFENQGLFDWLFADPSGAIVRVSRHPKSAAGWTSVDLPSLGLNGDYSIGFRNASPGVARLIRQGDVTHG
ncbi:hypothetical protein ABIA24_006725 [Sinorhizobium fredii]